MKRFCFLFLTALLLLPTHTARAVGFMSANIWLADQTPLVEQRVRVFTLVINQSEFDIVGSVDFLVDNRLIGREPLSISASTNNQVLAHDWIATQGEHNITAIIQHADALNADGTRHAAPIETKFASLDHVFVDIDTDGDGTGNRYDDDDDNDGLTDEQEAIMGSNPLLNDTDGDGVHDANDPDPLHAPPPPQPAPQVKKETAPPNVAPSNVFAQTAPQKISENNIRAVAPSITPLVEIIEAPKVLALDPSTIRETPRSQEPPTTPHPPLFWLILTTFVVIFILSMLFSLRTKTQRSTRIDDKS